MQCPKCRYEPTLAEHQGSPEQCPKCGVFYSKVATATDRPLPKAAVGRRKGSRSIPAIAVLLLAVAGGWFGYGFYKNQQTYRAVEGEVRLVSAHTKNVLAALDGSGGMTFAEYFGKADNAIKEIDSAIVRVTIIEPKNESIQQSVTYMKKAQEVVRLSSSSMRAALEFTSAGNRAESADSDFDSSNSYIRDAAYGKKLKALEDQTKAIESMKEARSNLVKAAAQLDASGQAIDGIDKSALIDKELYGLISKSNK